MNRRLRAMIFWILITIGVLFILRSIVGDVLLKRNGKCTTAFLINDIIRTKSQKATLLYEFAINGNTYNGNSLEEDLTSIGHSVCIVYLESFPSINKPLKYFEGEKIKCNCK